MGTTRTRTRTRTTTTNRGSGRPAPTMPATPCKRRFGWIRGIARPRTCWCGNCGRERIGNGPPITAGMTTASTTMSAATPATMSAATPVPGRPRHRNTWTMSTTSTPVEAEAVEAVEATIVPGRSSTIRARSNSNSSSSSDDRKIIVIVMVIVVDAPLSTTPTRTRTRTSTMRSRGTNALAFGHSERGCGTRRNRRMSRASSRWAWC
mmetsp:Transcript_9127/g.27125  ORF Transcript_9127/g.27125 Transcript_9127/m.27125 type:complete len:207 (+) Transcript_9127:593-1213(+)